MSAPLRILFCDDSGGAVRGFQRTVAEPLGESVETRCIASWEGFQQVRDEADTPFDVVVSDLNFEQVGGGPKDGLLILGAAHKAWPDAELILVTAYSGSLDADEMLGLGEAGLRRDHLFRKTEADDPAQLWARLRGRIEGILQSRQSEVVRASQLEREGFFHRSRALDQTIERLAGQDVDVAAHWIRGDSHTCFHGLVGQSYRMHEVLARVQRAAQRQSDALILGETGTGKELIARALHRASPRSDHPFVKTDLASLSAELVPSELFGHRRGAFTGAHQDRTGLVAEADGGVLFFDEIGNLPSPVQSGLLRLLEDRTFRPLGGDRDSHVTLTVLAATHVDLEAASDQGTFRADLLERLNVVRLELPPLRERREDIPLLAACFLSDLRKRFKVAGFRHFEADALDALARHPWPRNVRQLRNTIERLFSEFDDTTDPIGADHVRQVLPPEPAARAVGKSLSRRVLDGDEALTLAQLGKQFGEDSVREVIRDTLLELRGPPNDELAHQLFGGMRANTWRQYAFKRGLTYRNVLRGDA